MSRKIIIIFLAVLLVIILGGAVWFLKTSWQNNRPEENQAPKNDGFSVCVDECGNGICQPQNVDCKDNFNCICPETPAECPQDCK